jgi:hypothetical protein
MQDNINFTTKYYRPQKWLLRRKQDNSSELHINAIPGIDENCQSIMRISIDMTRQYV